MVIVGGGPAGLSAALILGRARRRVLLCDHGQYRNDAASNIHGFLTRDGCAPGELRRIGREEVRAYGVAVEDVEVTGARSRGEGFHLTLQGGRAVQARKLLLATGVRDFLPAIPGIESFYGVSVHHCPYCDGWEWRDSRIAVHGQGEAGRGLAASLLSWSRDVALVTDGPSRLARERRSDLERRGIQVIERRILRLEGTGPNLERIVFREGPPLERDALFFASGHEQRSPLAEQLGCRPGTKRSIWTDRYERTSVPGLFVAGDASRDLQLAILAAAEGARAAVAIHKELLAEAR